MHFCRQTIPYFVVAVRIYAHAAIHVLVVVVLIIIIIITIEPCLLYLT